MFINKIDPTVSYHVAIVGSGAAGLSVAKKMVKEKPNIKILIVESGDFERDDQIQSLSAVSATGDLPAKYYPHHAQRIFGGTTNIWGGYCRVLEERGFKENVWPISYDEISKYHKEASELIGISDDIYKEPYQVIQNTSNLIYKPFYLRPYRFRNYHEEYRQSQNIHVLLRHTCTKLMEKDHGIESIQLQNFDNKEFSIIRAKEYVLACGGIGNPRLLQLSNIDTSQAIGQYFMEHPHIYRDGIVELKKEVIEPLLQSKDKTYNIEHALSFSDDFCVRHGLLNFSASFQINKIVKRNLLGKKENMYISRTIIRAEMHPIASNRVTLGDNVDALDQKTPHIHFEFKYKELADKYWEIFAKELLASGIGRAKVLPEKYKITGGGHYLGTTRMGKNPSDSVVDSNCKVHGLRNLYIAGSSVFSASGTANPTFPIVVFSVRLGEHLVKKV